MKLGIVLQSNKPEHVWNTFRLGITSFEAGHKVEGRNIRLRHMSQNTGKGRNRGLPNFHNV